jgi:hypothetical protein
MAIIELIGLYLDRFCRVMRFVMALKNLMPDSAFIVLDKLKANLND